MTILEYQKLNNTSNKVYYFGGSFDPITLAHEEIYEYLESILNPDDLLLIGPNSDGYHFYDKNLTKLSIRLEMINKVFTKKHLIIDLPYEFIGVYDTLDKLNHPICVIGSDSLYYLSTWNNVDQLLKENTFLIIERIGFPLDILDKAELLKKYQDHFIISGKVIKNYSSTNVRCGNYEECSKEIKEIIDKYNLYRSTL